MQDWKDAYTAWAADKSPGKMADVLKAVQPTISYTLSALHADKHPAVALKAKALAVKAIQAYQPGGVAGLPTYLTHQLQPLARYTREVKSPIGASERHLLDAYHLHVAEQELTDKLERNPTVEELADYAKLPVKRITKLRKINYMSPAEASGLVSEESEYDYDQEAMDYAYAEADARDKQILEEKLGYGGKQPLTPGELAVKMGISPTELSRRSAKLAIKINDYAHKLRRNT